MKQFKLSVQFLVCLLIPIAVGGLSGYITAPDISDWYVTLIKPVFSPPNYIFAPVWSILYVLMGVSLYMIWILPVTPERKKALQYFGLQMILNFIWSLIFFTSRDPGLALLEIVLLWISIVFMIRQFKILNKSAANLQIPYLLWVLFETILNASIWFLN